MTDKISESLGMSPQETEEEKPESLPSAPESARGELLPAETGERSEDYQRSLEDYDTAREGIRHVIDRTKSASELMEQIADQSQHPRAFEVLSTLLKTQLDANRELVDLDNKRHERFGKPSEEDKDKSQGQGQSSVFVGTTNDLQRMVQQWKNGEIDEPTAEDLKKDE